MKKLFLVLLFAASAVSLSRAASATDLNLLMLATQHITDGPLVFVAPGDGFSYEIQVLNSSGVEAQSAALTDDLPDEIEVTEVKTDRGTCAKTAHSVSCDFGNIPTGTVTSVNVAVILDAATAKNRDITNSATVTAANEVNASNNTDSYTFTTADVTEGSGGSSGPGGGCNLVR